MCNSPIEGFKKKLEGKSIIPSQKYSYLFIDFIEFYAFFYKDEVTKSEILDYASDNDVDILKYFPNFTDQSDEEEDEELINTTGNSQIYNDELDNNRESAINGLFECLEYRQSILGEKYPFKVNKEEIVVVGELSPVQKTYILMLFSSMLNIFDDFQSIFTSSFESITFYALKELFPSYIIKEFGKKSSYTGTAIEKIKSLASDLNVSVDDIGLKDIHPKNNQERGLDLIVWKGFDDNIANMIIYLVQCACGKKWESKFSEVKRYRSYLNFKTLEPNFLFSTSYALNCNGSFSRRDDIISSEALFLDRIRIMSLISNESILQESLEQPFMIIDRIMREEISFR